MRTHSSAGDFLRGKNLSLGDLQKKKGPMGEDRWGRAKELSRLKCKYCKIKARAYGSHFVCDKCKKINDEKRAIKRALEREKRLRHRRFGEKI